MIDTRRNANDSGAGDRMHFHPVGIVTHPEFDFRVKIKEVSVVGVDEYNILVGNGMHMRCLRRLRLCSGGEINGELGRWHHPGPAEESSGRCHAVPFENSLGIVKTRSSYLPI